MIHLVPSPVPLLVCLLVPSALGLNSTTPGKVGWEPGPTQRGTLTLVWSCVATMFACTWSILHLNVPARRSRGQFESLERMILSRREGRPKERWYKAKWRKIEWKGYQGRNWAMRKGKWMAITIIFPEFIFAKAICELKDAVDDTMAMKKRSDNKELSWEVETGSTCEFLYKVFHSFDSEDVAWTTNDSTQTRESVPAPSPESGHLAPNDAAVPILETKDKQENIGIDEGDTSNVAKVSQRDHTGVGQAPVIDQTGTQEMTQTENKSPLRIGSKPSPRDPWSQDWEPWTLVHSYFANMGGFDEHICSDESSNNDPTDNDSSSWFSRDSYDFITTPVMLIRCLGFQNTRNANLFPSRTDIEDKGKAEPLVKLIAICQISWLVLSLIVRGSTHLPVSQLEIATLAFSVLSIGTYAANLWKPKDVNEPIKLSIHGRPGVWPLRDDYEQIREVKSLQEVAPFFKRIFRPSRPAGEDMYFSSRISNDTVRLQGYIPLLSKITAVSTMVFGGLHCIAWKFEFPSEAEAIIWRIASVASAIMPCIALFGNVLLAWLIRCRNQNFKRSLIHRLKLDVYPSEWWTSFDDKSCWRKEFESSLSKDELTISDYQNWNFMVARLAYIRIILSICESPNTFVANNVNIDRIFNIHGDKNHGEILPSWRKYEDFVKAKFKARGVDIPDGCYCDHLLAQKNILLNESIKVHNFTRKNGDQISRAITIFAGILYSIARVALLVICFTSLRSVPEDLYVTSWTRFMPNIS